jgi:mannonate dehydratase
MYRALAEHRLPLLTHAGDERATAGDDALGNPLRLRRALEAGVRVIVAHCATMGEGVDLDRGEHGPVQPNFALFSRLMDEARHDGRLFGDLSAIPQRARSGPVLATLLQRGAPGGPWAARLLYGSDYPIPGGMPLYSVAELARQGVLDAQRVAPLRALRRHNAWLFDLVLKRLLRAQGQGFAPEVFATRRVLGGR